MQDTPAPEGDIQPVEKGPEPSSHLDEGKEAPIGPPKPEVARSAEPTGASERPPTSTKQEAESAGSQAARTLLEANQPAEVASQQSNEPPKPTTRKMDPLTRSALQHTAVRQARLSELGKEAA